MFYKILLSYRFHGFPFFPSWESSSSKNVTMKCLKPCNECELFTKDELIGFHRSMSTLADEIRRKFRFLLSKMPVFNVHLDVIHFKF